MLTRWTRKIVIIGLAVLGAQRLFDLARRRVDRVTSRVTPHLHDAADRARDAADDVTGDMTDARQVLKDAAQDVSADLADAAHEVKAGDVLHDVKSVAVQADSPNVSERTGTA